MPAAPCPNTAVCNFHRAALDADAPWATPLLEHYCFNAAGNGSCFRSHFMRRQSANLSADIAPNATIVAPLAGFAAPSDMAADTVARIYARA